MLCAVPAQVIVYTPAILSQHFLPALYRCLQEGANKQLYPHQ